MADRQAALKAIKFRNQADKEKWQKILTTEMMSSEESVSDEGEEVLKVKKLSWRKPIVEDMLKKLDSTLYSSKSPQARRQMKRRVLGEVSNREIVEDAPKWAITQ